MPQYVKVITLGCPKNVVDSRQMMSSLVEAGYILTDDASRANIILINTCAFIEDAKEESIETILEMARWKEHGNCEYLIAAGCLAQKYTHELIRELPEVDMYLGTGDIPSLCRLLKSIKPGQVITCVGDPNNYLYEEGLPSAPEQVKHYAYLKIAEGCNNRCSYCVIPSIRGAYRSRRMEDIVKEAEALTAAGVKELILIAQDTTLYGLDIYGALMLPGLLKELARLPKLTWIRILYSYPAHITDVLLQTMKEEKKICRYLDIPLQHISDNILTRMGRTTGREETLRLLDKIRSYLPDVVLRSTFIVGFPGESANDFEELLVFLKKTGFDRAGFFAYSREPDTQAAQMPGQISRKEKLKRLQQAEDIQREILTSKQAGFVGKIVTVMVDGPSPDYEGLWEGRTAGDAPEIDGVVYFKPHQSKSPGDLVDVKITHSQEFALMGEIKP